MAGMFGGLEHQKRRTCAKKVLGLRVTRMHTHTHTKGGGGLEGGLPPAYSTHQDHVAQAEAQAGAHKASTRGPAREVSH